MSENSLRPLTEQDIDKLKTVVSDVLQQAQQRGASAAEVIASTQMGLSTTIRQGDVETMAFHRDKGIGITVYFGQQKGSASTSDTSPKALTEAVTAASEIAQYTSADEYAGLADPTRLATHFPDLQTHFPWAISPEDAISLAKECEDEGRATAGITNTEGATLDTGQGATVYGNSNGFLAGRLGSRHGLSCVLIGSKADKMQRDYWYTVARDPQDMEAGKLVAQQAAARTLSRLGARKLATTQAPVLFTADVAGGLFGTFVSAISGSSLYRKASFLLDHLNQLVFSDHLNITEQPHLPKALGSAVYDAEGVATYAHPLVEEGVLKSYILGSYSARKLGMASTANAGGIHNLCVEPGSQNFAELVRTMHKGLVVTELMGQGINLVTGDYSRGAAGFWVENGEIQYPVEEITIAGNLRQMFQDIVAVGNDIDKRSSILTGSVLIQSMTIAGQS